MNKKQEVSQENFMLLQMAYALLGGGEFGEFLVSTELNQLKKSSAVPSEDSLEYQQLQSLIDCIERMQGFAKNQDTMSLLEFARGILSNCAENRQKLNSISRQASRKVMILEAVLGPWSFEHNTRVERDLMANLLHNIGDSEAMLAKVRRQRNEVNRLQSETNQLENDNYALQRQVVELRNKLFELQPDIKLPQTVQKRLI